MWIPQRYETSASVVRERRAAPLQRSLRGGDEVRQRDLVEPALHLRGIGDVEEVTPPVDRSV